MNTFGFEHLGWVTEPEGRGTAGLLYGCLFTAYICTWSALHMNVPADDDSASQTFFRKLKWMAFGVFFPEFLCTIALHDREDAEDLYDIMKQWSQRSQTVSAKLSLTMLI